jgi:hypothetical protein
LISNQNINGDFKEIFRFLSIPLMLISLFILNVNYDKLIKFAIFITRLFILYNVYEFVIINFYSISEDPFYTQIIKYYGTSTGQYFQYTWDYGIPLYRPYGIFLQVQKSAFIFPLGIILQYIYKKYINPFSKSFFWNIVLILSVFLSLGKTATLLSIILIFILYIDINKIKIKTVILIFILFIISFYLSIYIGHNSVQGTMSKDIVAYLNLDINEVLFGKGYIKTTTYFSLNYAHEVFFIRLLTTFGLINFIILIILYISILNKINKINIAIVAFLLFSVIHYSIMNIQYFIYILGLMILYVNFMKTTQKGKI